jgi:hypothetical protein
MPLIGHCQKCSLFFLSSGDFVIRNEVAWCHFWDDVFANRYPPPPCDTTLIDFQTEPAIVSAIGSRRNGCYDSRTHCLHSAEHGKWNVDAEILDRTPGPGCICSRAIVNPVHVVKVKRRVGKLTGYHNEPQTVCR